MTGHELIAESWRSGFLESAHHGSAVAVDRSGDVVLSVGEPEAPMYPRSSHKPVQALAMLRHGLDLDGELLALGSASHSGEDFHIAGVRRILDRAGLGPEALQCPPGLPIGEAALHAHLASGGEKTPLHMNCSGKHAAMLLTCARNGWPVETYRDPAHPLQRAIHDTIEELTGEQIAATGVDGCGAPLHAIPLVGLARAFGRLAAATGGLERRVADAMRAHPEWVGGTGDERIDSTLMRRLPGVIAKDGAEGVSAVGLPDGAGVAVKIADGSARARPVTVVAALHRLDPSGISAVEELATTPVTGRGEPVGVLRPAGRLAPEPVGLSV